jgi:hypothetical protein
VKHITNGGLADATIDHCKRSSGCRFRALRNPNESCDRWPDAGAFHAAD